MAAPKGNKFALGNNGGRPPKYKTKKALEAKIEEYFSSLFDEDGVQTDYPTVTGLALFLGFSGRKYLYQYAEKQEFRNTIKRALTAVEQSYERQLYQKGSTGAIFALKNMGWKDEQHVKDSKGIEALSDEELEQLINKLESK